MASMKYTRAFESAAIADPTCAWIASGWEVRRSMTRKDASDSRAVRIISRVPVSQSTASRRAVRVASLEVLRVELRACEHGLAGVTGGAMLQIPLVVRHAENLPDSGSNASK